MKLEPYVDKVNASLEYKQFIQKNSDAFLVAGFFILDLELGQRISQIDYYIPSQKKFAAFTLDEKINLQILNAMINRVPERLDEKSNVDIDAIKGILEDEMKNRNITEDIKKIITVVQNIKGKKVWNVNCVLSGMDVLKAHIEDETETILGMEKTSFVDIMKKLPGNNNPFMPPKPSQDQAQTQQDLTKQIEKLRNLKSVIKKEEKTLKKKLSKKEKIKIRKK